MKLALEKINVNKGSAVYLADINLVVEPGMNMLLGPTGAGKTSLLRIIAGLENVSAGRVLLDGVDITRWGVRKRPIAMVYQQFVNYPSFTIYENIASPLRQAKEKLSAAEIDRRVQEAAARMRIGDLLQRLPAQLSGGQQQRTAIARALVKGAQILLLDEPLVNLDYKLREELRQELRDLFEQSGTIVVYATTEPPEALLLGGRVAIMDQGRILQSGNTLDVYRRPDTARIGEIFSDPPMNLLPCYVTQGKIQLDKFETGLPSHIRALADGEYVLGVRANHIHLDLHGVDVIPLEVGVELAEIGGSQTYLHLRRNALQFVAELSGVHSYNPGDRITVGLESKRLFAFGPDRRLIGAPLGIG